MKKSVIICSFVCSGFVFTNCDKKQALHTKKQTQKLDSLTKRLKQK